MSEKPRKKYQAKNFDTQSEFSKPRKPAQKKVQPQGMHVIVYDDDVMKAWRLLKRKLTNENVLQEVKDRRYYTKPSLINRKKREEAVKKERKRQIKLADKYGIQYADYDPMSNSRPKKRSKRR